MAKRCPKIADRQFSDMFLALLGALEAPSGNLSPDSCRGGPKLRFEYSNIKIGQELTSEMSKM